MSKENSMTSMTQKILTAKSKHNQAMKKRLCALGGDITINTQK